MANDRMKSRNVTKRLYSINGKPSLTAFKALVEQATTKETYPLAADIQKSIPVYDCSTIDLDDPGQVDAWQDELNHILTSGPGVYVLQNFFTDHTSIDAANTAYSTIIDQELATNGAKGDHFASAGTNSRIWNSLQKHCIQSPSSFLSYYSNSLWPVVCESYLGPSYRLTAQVNIVKPGGKAQVCHRDYHLGFQTAETCAMIPKALHITTQFLTLQGAVAHTDMPLESGPTRFLPYSQGFEEGYMAYRLPEFNEYFLEHYVSLPLRKGDAVFFSPALFHAAGENVTTDFERCANLIQVSSAFGKTMETIDSLPLIEATFEEFQGWHEEKRMAREVEAFVKAVGVGYSFPTNLDKRPPAPGGMAPESEQDVLKRALKEGWGKEKVMETMRGMREDSKA
ncbi:hypothetical protein DOTSEDRAFT_63638 [Dothistroma septosporum NZE10]|uniref:Phytanoyl-CoA dioxygenase-like protein n=1 Tax=Dothistroma septosporum (strain NZE10 / CBS 128990) TaxID=675120 RepID=M2YP65_DOTSN|nr:hypothetical protein DOTSEDRAFT_63638 [Dothistroma septosporum NZE10]